MIPSNITVTDGITSGTDLVLDKISEQNGESIFTGSYVSNGANRHMRLSVKHTNPADPTKSSSHLLKLTITRYLSDGTYDRTLSAHMVFQSDTGVNSAINGGTLTTFSNLLAHSSLMDEWNRGAY